MRFAYTVFLALPLLAAAAQEQSPLDYVKEQAQYYFDKISSYIPNPNRDHPIEAAATKASGKTIDFLTIDNWKSVLQPETIAYGNKPEEWWVLVTGGNKTCYGQCRKVEAAFNESALAFKVIPSAPHLAYVNCDYQPILCNSWAAGPPNLWVFEVRAPGIPVDVHITKLNSTAITVKTFTELYSTRSWAETPKYEGYFHPFDGPVAKFGLAEPLAYVFWVFSIIPSWAFMIGLSFFSRTVIGRRSPVSNIGAPRPAPAAAPAS